MQQPVSFNIQYVFYLIYKSIYSVLGFDGSFPFALPSYSGTILFFLALISLVCLFGIMYLRSEMRRMYRDQAWELHHNVKERREPRENKLWTTISGHANSESATDWKLAIIEADKLLDDALKERGVTGESMGERLKTFDFKKSPWIEDAWEAHKLRNRVAHESGFEPNRYETRRAIAMYERVLRELGAI